MSLERIFKTLLALGLSETDSRVYILISFKGPITVRKIIEDMKIHKQQLYSILKKLHKKEIIEVTTSRPKIITAVPFEIVLEMLINSKIEESKKILGNKNDLLSCWKVVKWNNGA